MSVEFLNNDFEKVGYLQNMLVAHATGGSAESAEYETLRHELLSNSLIADKLPSWLKIHRNLDSFWGFIQPKLASYRERRVFLAEEFAPVIFWNLEKNKFLRKTSPLRLSKLKI